MWISKVLRVPEFQDQDQQRRANILVVSQFMVFFIVAAIVIFASITTPEHTETSLEGGLGMAAMVISYLFLRHGKLEIAAWIVGATGWMIFTLDLAIIAGIRGVSIYGQILMIMFSGLVISGKSALVMTVATLTANFAVLRMETMGILEDPMPLPANDTRWFIQTAYAILAALYIWTSDNVIRRNLSWLRASADQYRALFDLTNDGVLLIGLDWKILAANKAALRMFGFTREEFVGMEVDRWKEFQDPELMEERRIKILAGEEVLPFEEALTIKGGDTIYVEMSLALVHDSDQQPVHIQCILRDVTKRKEYELKLEQQALYDPLTNLPNRILFEDRYQLARISGHPEESMVAVLFVDLDNFKKVNDDFGHGVGDQVLMILGQRLQSSLRETDTVARMGGDEFVIILEDIHNKGDVSRIAQKLRDHISEPMRVDGNDIKVTASIGINITEKSKLAETDLVKTSDSAMYQVKEEGKNDYKFFDEN